jgi:hypothetical protein
MKHGMLIILATTLTLSLCSCVTERETVWAEPGEPARVTDIKEVKTTDKDNDPNTVRGETILDDTKLSHIIKTSKGEDKTSKASLKGMCVIDEPTLMYYKELHRLYGKDFQRRKAAGEFDK